MVVLRVSGILVIRGRHLCVADEDEGGVGQTEYACAGRQSTIWYGREAVLKNTKRNLFYIPGTLPYSVAPVAVWRQLRV